MSKLRIVPWFLGLVLILGTLVGANQLLHSSAGSATPPSKPAAPSGTDGLIAKGTVHSDPPTVPYTLPAHLQAGTVEVVNVQSGSQVKEDDVLIVFDHKLLLKDLEKAKQSHAMALQDYEKAKSVQTAHAIVKKQAALAIKEAKEKRKAAQEALDLTNRLFEERLEILKNENGTLYTPEQKEKQRRDDMTLPPLRNRVSEAENLVAAKENDAEALPYEEERLMRVANIAALQANAIKEEVEKIEQAIRNSTLRAKSAGIVEQVTVAKGQTVPPALPLLYLVPSGKRVVWAEIVPDFSHKIKDRDGQKVTITDDSNPQLTYEGIVHRTRSAFLPKPNGAPDMINGKPNVVLIVEVEVVDPAPAGKPPLRVGQPVRVIFP